MSFTVTTDQGVVSAHVTPGGYVDAAVAGAMAGFEFGVDGVTANDALRSERHASCTVTLSMSPETMRAWAVLLAEKSGMPLLNEREWQTVCHALRVMDAECKRDDGEPLAERIERAWPS